VEFIQADANTEISFSKDMPDGKGLSEEKITDRNTKKVRFELGFAL
jgi:hypothetical protein